MSEMQKMGFTRPSQRRCAACGWEREAKLVIARAMPQFKDVHACERCGNAMVKRV